MWVGQRPSQAQGEVNAGAVCHPKETAVSCAMGTVLKPQENAETSTLIMGSHTSDTGAQGSGVRAQVESSCLLCARPWV